MRKIIATLTLIIAFSALSAQINHENTYNHSGTYTQLSVSGNKFFVMDFGLNQCRIYNTDHSLWKTINLAVPSNHYLYDIRFVSENLFTTDNSLSLIYIYYNYNTTGQYYTYTARIIRENGTELLNIPGCQYVYVHSLPDLGTKLVAYSFDYSTYPDYGIQTHVYSLPGQLPNSADLDIGALISMPDAYPNPAGSFITIPVSLPEGVSRCELIITDIRGQALKQLELNRETDQMLINTAHFPRGTYLYYLKTKGIRSEASKFIVN
jgi:hypothetical protein